MDIVTRSEKVHGDEIVQEDEYPNENVIVEPPNVRCKCMEKSLKFGGTSRVNDEKSKAN